MKKRSNRVFLVGLVCTLGMIAGCRTAMRNSGRVEQTTADRLESDVRTLSERYGQRNVRNRAVLDEAGYWVGDRFEAMGYSVSFEAVPTDDVPFETVNEGFNVIAELKGTDRPEEVVIIGAHYDAEVTTAGADDNASGVAGMLELARRFARSPQPRTIRWVAFTNEENSNSANGAMGSMIHAKGCKERDEQIVAMISLEMLGYFSDEPDSQRYPFPPEMASKLGMELPTVGNYIGVVGRFADRALIDTISDAMLESGTIPVTRAAMPAMVQAIYRSDHALFWMQGYDAVMVTDTSEYRNPNYHRAGDVPESLDFVRMGRVVDGLEGAVRVLGDGE